MPVIKARREIMAAMHYVAAAGHSPSMPQSCHSGKEAVWHMGDIAHNPVTEPPTSRLDAVFDLRARAGDQSRNPFWIGLATDRIR